MMWIGVEIIRERFWNRTLLLLIIQKYEGSFFSFIKGVLSGDLQTLADGPLFLLLAKYYQVCCWNIIIMSTMQSYDDDGVTKRG